jgi:putative PEP-CTERM system histidine kinase
MIPILYALNLLLVGSCAISLGIKTRERRLTLSLLQALAGLPLLALFCGFFSYQGAPEDLVQALLFSDGVFGVLWIGLGLRLARLSTGPDREPWLFSLTQVVIGLGLAAVAVFAPAGFPGGDASLAFSHGGQGYFYALSLLTAVLFVAWRLEVFWRALEPARRWEYKFLAVGAFSVCGALAWAASYRLTYRQLVADHFLLLAGLLIIGWAMMGYAVLRHKLLNRKIFVSRKIVYTFVAPTVFAAYFCALGAVGLLMQRFGLALPFVLNGLAVGFGLIALGLFACSPTLRRRVKFFISTHFYVNKYEYRDEWLTLSARLQGAETEAEVVDALQQVLAASLYARRQVIWTGDTERGYTPLAAQPPLEDSAHGWCLAPDDPLMGFLTGHAFFHLPETAADPVHREVAARQAEFFAALDIVLVVPLKIGDRLVGLIGLGPEFTGGRYDRDDFDLLTALASQTAAALLAVRMAEKLAHARERRAWERLSAFVLHDIKNAAAMLALMRQNAPAHLHDPEFQQDMLAAVDDALARMGKVQQRLDLLKAEIAPAWTDLPLKAFLEKRCRELGRKLPGMSITLDCPPDARITTDPTLLARILENLLLNAFEAGGDPPAVTIAITLDPTARQVALCVTDNGPGIAQNLLPDALFEPFKTTKPQGSGIGLWQARQLAQSLNGSLCAENLPGGGAAFLLRLPG